MKCNYNTIKSIIDQWDPLLLLHMTPDDEYDLEIKKIVKFINASDYINDSELAKEIQNIFLLAFGSSFHKDYDTCIEISKKILEEI